MMRRMGSAGETNLDAVVAEALVGSRAAGSRLEALEWLDHAERHRVEVLLADRWIAAASADPALGEIRAKLAEMLRLAALVDAIRDAECRRVYAALSAAGLRTAVLKGAALAATVYREPYLRPRCDTDILVDHANAGAAAQIFLGLGYTADVETSGALVTAQSHFSRLDANGRRHAWDVHWRACNAHAAADILPLDRIAGTGQRVAALEGLVVPSPADALLLACVHRVVHHHDAPDLLWLYDIHLLAGRLSPMDWSGFDSYASDRGVWPICARSLSRARERFGTRLPEPIAAATAAAAGTPLDGFERGGREVDLLRMNLRALKTWPERLRLLREHLFPPAAFIVDRYHIGHRAALPWAYLHRIVTGAPKWFRRHGAA
jgi:hypothetical protein